MTVSRPLFKIRQTNVKGYVRFDLNPEMSKFEYVAENKVQVILGTNSSGKSSLAGLFTLYPIEHQDLHPEGYVHIQVEKEKDFYELDVSKEIGKIIYSFKVNGVELNTTHRITEQKKLVAEHFGITQQLHQLLTGETRFTDMSVAERRKWIVDLSDMDYEYILSVYNDIRKKLSYYKDVISHNNKRIIADAEFIESVKPVELEKQHILLSNALEKLLEDKLPTARTLSATLKMMETRKGRLKTVDNNIEKITAKMNRLSMVINPKQKSNVNKMILKCTVQLESESTLLKEKQRSVASIRDQLPPPTADRSKLEKTLIELTKLPQPTVEDKYQLANPKTLLIQLNTVRTLISDTTEHLLTNHDYNTDMLSKLVTDGKALHAKKIEVEQLAKKVTITQQDHAHRLRSPSVKCPKCTEVFHHGYDKKIHVQAKLEVEEFSRQLATINTELETSREGYVTCKTQIDLRKGIHAIYERHPALKPIWNEAGSDYASLDNLMETYTIHLTAWNDVLIHREKLDEVRSKLKVYENIDTASAEVHSKEIELVSKQITKLIVSTNAKVKLKSELTKLQSFKEQLERLVTTKKELVDKLESLHEELVVINDQSDINKQITENRTALAKIDSDLTTVKVKQGILDKLKSVVEQYTEEKKNLTDLYEALSPTKGFIAHSLLNFISTFVSGINEYIAQIWEYPLSVGVPESEDASLNFRFKLHIANTAPKSDISKGSSAILQIINLAFTLAVMKRMGLENHPIILDEIGGPMDTQHSINVYTFIKQTLVNNSDNQVFIISHDPVMYSVFDDVNTDYVVMDSRNVDISSLGGDVNKGITTK